MRRILLFLLAALVGLIAACARPDDDGSGGAGGEPLVWPTGPAQVLASYKVGDGFVSYSWHLMEGPRLVVYSDGRAVADSRRTLTLSSGELSALVRDLRRDLAGLGPNESASGGMQVSDAPTTVLKVRNAAGGLHSVSAYALGMMDGYPKRLAAARDRLDVLAQRVLASGTPYTSDRVRLVVEARDTADGAVRPWPVAVPLPPALADTSSGVRSADLNGAAAAAAAANLPGDDWQAPSPWPVLKTADGKLVAVAWRYLNPDE